MRQVILQALNVFAALLLEAIDFDDLGNQYVIGLTDGLSGNVHWPSKAPLRHCVQRPADDVPIRTSGAQSPRPAPASATGTT